VHLDLCGDGKGLLIMDPIDAINRTFLGNWPSIRPATLLA
jgi:hypothetical protein